MILLPENSGKRHELAGQTTSTWTTFVSAVSSSHTGLGRSRMAISCLGVKCSSSSTAKVFSVYEYYHRYLRAELCDWSLQDRMMILCTPPFSTGRCSNSENHSGTVKLQDTIMSKVDSSDGTRDEVEIKLFAAS
jgi:hypothetical protein